MTSNVAMPLFITFSLYFPHFTQVIELVSLLFLAFWGCFGEIFCKHMNEI